MENTKQIDDTLSWSLFIGCMFIGMAIGAAFDSEGAGTLAGMGVGYIASAIAEHFMKK